jgi:hypothetical protein
MAMSRPFLAGCGYPARANSPKFWDTPPTERPIVSRLALCYTQFIRAVPGEGDLIYLRVVERVWWNWKTYRLITVHRHVSGR